MTPAATATPWPVVTVRTCPRQKTLRCTLDQQTSYTRCPACGRALTVRRVHVTTQPRRTDGTYTLTTARRVYRSVQVAAKAARKHGLVVHLVPTGAGE